MRTYQRFAFTSIISIILATSALYAAITVERSDAQQLVLNWELSHFDTTTRGSNQNDPQTSLTWPESNCEISTEDQSTLPAFSFYAGIPQTGTVQISIIPLATRTIKLTNRLLINQITTQSPSAVPQQRWQNQWISEATYAKFRDYQAAQWIIRPFLYNKTSQTIQVLNRAQIIVTFPASNKTPAALRQNDYDRMLAGLFLNYPVAAQWRVPAVKSLAKKLAATAFAPGSGTLLTFAVGDGHAGFNEGTTSENGIYKISGSDLLKLPGANANSSLNNFTVYASSKHSLPFASPGPSTIPAGVTEASVVRYDAAPQGVLDTNDYLLVYGTGASDWVFNTISKKYTFKLNRFEDYRHYWVGYSPLQTGRTMPRLTSVTQTPDTTLNHSLQYILFRQSKTQPLNSIGQKEEGQLEFIWQNIPKGGTFTQQLPIPWLDASMAGSIFVPLTYNNGASITLSFAGSQLCANCPERWNPITTWGDTTLTVSVANFFAGIEELAVAYHQKLDMTNRTTLSFFSPTDSAQPSRLIRYHIAGLKPTLRSWIFRIEQNDQATLIDTIRGSAYEFTDTASRGFTYYIHTDNSLIATTGKTTLSTPAAPQSLTIVNPRDTTNRADYLIISPPSLATEAMRLARHKLSSGRFLAPRVVLVDDIYNSFCGGNTDPAAIRNFLLYALNFWSSKTDLAYVVLLGNGVYDIKHYLPSTQKTNLIPSAYAKIASFPYANEVCSDDFYTILDSGKTFNEITAAYASLFLGRITCNTTAEASAVINKIIETETIATADFGAWRNRGLLIADDDKQALKDDPLSTAHAESSENLAEVLLTTRPSIDLRKTYLYDFPWTSIGLKPDATPAIINEINNGVAFVNYFGHGSPSQWTDEYVMANDNTASLTNTARYPIVSSFSCSVGRFDSPEMVSLSEAFLLAPHAGAIATIASTRTAFATQNETIAKKFYTQFLTGRSTSIGMAFFTAKTGLGVSDIGYGKVYALLGDPSIRFINGTNDVQLSINHADGRISDTVKALERIVLHGVVTAEGGATNTGFGTAARPAFVQIGLFNPYDTASRKDGGGNNPSANFLKPGTPLFQGVATVNAGVFTQEIFIPRTVVFNKPGVRLSAYAWQDTCSGLGYSSSIIFAGTYLDSSGDSSGPRISIRKVFEDAKLQSNASATDRITSELPLTMAIDLFDENGIDVASNGPDDGLNYEIKGIMQRQNINYKFQFAEGDYRRGSAVLTFEENSMPKGTYVLTVSARDMIGNFGNRTFALEITPGGTFAFDHIFNFPNPVRIGATTRFYFAPSLTTQAWNTHDVTVRLAIYTLGGRLLRVFDDAHNGQEWNGCDQLGNQLGPNVYLYRITAHSRRLSKTIKSDLQKIVIYPPQ